MCCAYTLPISHSLSLSLSLSLLYLYFLDHSSFYVCMLFIFYTKLVGTNFTLNWANTKIPIKSTYWHISWRVLEPSPNSISNLKCYQNWDGAFEGFRTAYHCLILSHVTDCASLLRRTSDEFMHRLITGVQKVLEFTKMFQFLYLKIFVMCSRQCILWRCASVYGVPALCPCYNKYLF